MSIQLEHILKNSKKAVLLGIGGGADIVGTIPTKHLLQLFNIECLLGGLPWERSVVDPFPGPRDQKGVKNINVINDSVWLGNGQTKTVDNIPFAESHVAKYYKEDVLFIDLHRGSEFVAKNIIAFMKSINADLLIGIDVGGDVLAFGHEKGLGSPLADGMMLATMVRVAQHYPTILGMFGWGSDGELTSDELEHSLSVTSQNGGYLGAWGLTPPVIQEMDAIIANVHTDASRIPLLCAKGKRGAVPIREGRRNIEAQTAGSITFYLDPNIVFEHISRSARLIYDSTSLISANETLLKEGFSTELDFEQKKLNGK